MMDEEVGEEVTPLNASEGGHLHNKDSEYSVKSDGGSMTESQELVIPGDTTYSESFPHVLADILEGKNVNRSLSSVDTLERPVANAPFMDDVGGMVEELTVRNYNNLNLAVVGTSDSCDKSRTRTNQWLRYYNTGGLSASGSSHGCSLNREDKRAVSGVWGDIGNASLSELSPWKPLKEDPNEVEKPVMMSENGGGSGNVVARGGFRTKILSKSGFSEFFVKSTLKGKGVIFRGPPVENPPVEGKSQRGVKFANASNVTSDASPSPLPKTSKPASNVAAGFRVVGPDSDGVNLREWLNNVHSEVNKVERLHIFKQIVELVENSHSQGVALHDLCPSCFILLPLNCVEYAGSMQCRGKQEILTDKNSDEASHLIATKRMSDHEPSSNFGAKKIKFGEGRNYRQLLRFAPWQGAKVETSSGRDINIADSHVCHEQHQSTGYWSPQSSIPRTISAFEQQLTVVSKQLEEKWYCSPEEHSEEGSKISKDIYGLGVLLFELLGHFESERARNAAMMDMHHRILPPKFLSENPKEAGFCLWLLHPDPSSRPSVREILESEVLSGLEETSASVQGLFSSIEQEDMESELLLHFLVTINEQKQKHVHKLVENIRCLEEDIEEIGRRRGAKPLVAKSSLLVDSIDGRANKCHHNDFLMSDMFNPASNMKESRWVGNMAHLETAYFSMRSRIQHGENDPIRRSDNELLRARENYYPVLTDGGQPNSADRVGGFFEGLCKYARFSKFKVRGVLRNGEFNNSANVICSLSFDRDDEYFAAAGVSKKIKIFEFNALLNHTADIHYPVVEMSNGSKLSCVCWNNYIRNYLASTDYDGVVKLWDASTGKDFSEFSEHEKRAWSVDFSPVYPTKLASGSDDCSVKIWSLNERNSSQTIRNIANVCCVQFSSHSSHFLAFGSADYKTYCYDLRNARSPWCILAGHEKAVSYIKFVDSETLITASTDNTLKLWDLNKTSHSGLSTGACSLTLRGHKNEKNFVGLSVANGYITCGSETNEVFAYHRSLPMPITSYKFGSIDSISGKETDHDNGQFVSSVCWRGKSDMVVAANSSGCIKVLQMV